MRCILPGVFASLLLGTSTLSPAAAPVRPSPAPVRPVSEDYFGTKVTDPYRYMENMKDPAVLDWVRGQGRLTRTVFDSIPARAAFAQKVSAFTGAFDFVQSLQSFGGRIFYEERAPGSDNFDLVVREADGSTRKIIDVGAVRAAHGGAPYAINYYQASPDGKHVAVGISAGGSENAVLTVYDVATLQPISASIERAVQASPTFTDDGKTVFFSQLADVPDSAPRTQKYLNSSVFVWDLKSDPKPVLGHLAASAPAIPASFFPFISTTPGARVVVGAALDGVHPEYDLWVSPLKDAVAGTPRWTPVLQHDDGVIAIDIVGDTMFLLSHNDAPTFQVLSLKVGEPLSSAKVLLPAQTGRVLESIHGAADGVYVTAREGVYSKLLRVPIAGGPAVDVPLPFKGSIAESFTDERKPGAALIQESWVVPPVAIAVDASLHAKQLALGTAPASYHQDAFEVFDLKPTARDGTVVPLSYVRVRGDTKPQIVMLYAYGSYGISSYPGFNTRAIPFMQEGHAAFATCHVRGGGELGEAWRLGGKDANKPNTWRDLIACGEFLIANGYTTRQKLFIGGASAGGITMGMALTERPDLWAGVLDEVPMASALRHEFQVNGPANIPEFGTVTKKQDFRNLLAMDSYQHVKDGVNYPPVMLTTGLNDPRVDPWQPAKMTARLLASGTRNPVLLRVEETAGHGIGSTRSQGDALMADRAAFMFWQAGLPGWAPTVKP